jgi:hypothetical protein
MIEKGIVTNNRINSVLELPKGLDGAEGEDMRAVANSLQGRASQAGALFGRLCVGLAVGGESCARISGRLPAGFPARSTMNLRSREISLSLVGAERRDTIPSPPEIT